MEHIEKIYVTAVCKFKCLKVVIEKSVNPVQRNRLLTKIRNPTYSQNIVWKEIDWFND